MEFDLTSEPPLPPRTQAEWESKCAACGDWIYEGDWIIKDEDENWIHEDCA
jgi:hypothetical protein